MFKITWLGVQNGSHLYTDEVRCSYGISHVVTNAFRFLAWKLKSSVFIHSRGSALQYYIEKTLYLCPYFIFISFFELTLNLVPFSYIVAFMDSVDQDQAAQNLQPDL